MLAQYSPVITDYDANCSASLGEKRMMMHGAGTSRSTLHRRRKKARAEQAAAASSSTTTTEKDTVHTAAGRDAQSQATQAQTVRVRLSDQMGSADALHHCVDVLLWGMVECIAHAQAHAQAQAQAPPGDEEEEEETQEQREMAAMGLPMALGKKRRREHQQEQGQEKVSSLSAHAYPLPKPPRLTAVASADDGGGGGSGSAVGKLDKFHSNATHGRFLRPPCHNGAYVCVSAAAADILRSGGSGGSGSDSYACLLFSWFCRRRSRGCRPQHEGDPPRLFLS